jgi:hypothetical protein
MRSYRLPLVGGGLLVAALGGVACSFLTSVDDLSADYGMSEDAGSDARDSANVDGHAEADRPPSQDAPCHEDVSSDPLNCGSCGHDCLGGSCNEGTCAPAIIALDDGVANDGEGIAVNSIYVYWAAFSGSIRRIALVTTEGPEPPPLFSSGGNLSGLAVRGSTLFWSQYQEDGTVTAASLSATGGATLPGVVVNPGCLAFDGSGNVYVTSFQSDGGSILTNGDGGWTTVVGQLVQPWGVALDAQHVYWTTFADPEGGVWQANLDGGNVVQLASGQSDPGCLALDGTTLYWPNIGANGGLQRLSLTPGSKPTTLIMSPPDVMSLGIAVDDKAIYFGISSELFRLAK